MGFEKEGGCVGQGSSIGRVLLPREFNQNNGGQEALVSS